MKILVEKKIRAQRTIALAQAEIAYLDQQILTLIENEDAPVVYERNENPRGKRVKPIYGAPKSNVGVQIAVVNELNNGFKGTTVDMVVLLAKKGYTIDRNNASACIANAESHYNVPLTRVKVGKNRAYTYSKKGE